MSKTTLSQDTRRVLEGYGVLALPSAPAPKMPTLDGLMAAIVKRGGETTVTVGTDTAEARVALDGEYHDETGTNPVTVLADAFAAALVAATPPGGVGRGDG